ncbi:class I SAM-dependent methyltransferase [Mycobacterium sp. BMJ-28]
MTKDHPHSVIRAIGNKHDYLPAAGRDVLLPGYDLLTRVLGMPPAYDELIAQAGLFAGARVLEIGCGTGNLTSRVRRSQSSSQVTGIDPDPRALARARKKCPGVTFEKGYAQRLPFGDGAFDRVLSSMMLHHLDPEAKGAALAEAFRVLTPGGSLHIVDVVGRHLSATSGADELPGLLRATGFECAELGSRRLRLVGPVAFYRGTRA